MSRNIAIRDGSGLCKRCGYRTATMSVSTCPACGGPIVGATKAQPRRKIRFLALPSMLYPRAYKWFVLISAVDLVLTWFILLLGGQEVNVLADAVIAHAGLKGILLYKFCLVILVVLLCEVVGRRRPRLGRKLALGAIAITALPVVLSLAQFFLA